MKHLCFKDRQGRQFQFEVYPLDTRFPADKGVVMILQGNHPVGLMEGDLTRIIDDEMFERAQLLHGADQMAVLIDDHVNNRQKVSDALLDAYDPVCNRGRKRITSKVVSELVKGLKKATGKDDRYKDYLRDMPLDKFFAADNQAARVLGRRMMS